MSLRTFFPRVGLITSSTHRLSIRPRLNGLLKCHGWPKTSLCGNYPRLYSAAILTTGDTSHTEASPLPLNPFSHLLDRLRTAVASQSVAQAHRACEAYLSRNHSSDAVLSTAELQQSRATIISALQLLASGDSDDLVVLGRVIGRMHDLWGLEMDLELHTRILQALLSSGRLVSAQNWLADMSQKPGHFNPTREHWDMFLRQCHASADAKLLQSSLPIMRNTGYPPDEDTYSILFETLFMDGSYPETPEVKKLVEEMQQDGVPFTRAFVDLLTLGYEKACSVAFIAEVTALYEQLRGAASSNVIGPSGGLDRNQMLAAIASEDKNRALKLLQVYYKKGFRPTRETLVAISETAERVADLVFWEKKLGVKADGEMWTTLIQNAAFKGTPTSRYNALEAYRTVGRHGIPKTVDMFYPLLRAVCTTSIEAPSEKIIDQAMTYLEDFLKESSEEEQKKALPVYQHLLRSVTMTRNKRKYRLIAMQLAKDMLARDLLDNPIYRTSTILQIMECCRRSSHAFDAYTLLQLTKSGESALDIQGYEAVINAFCKRSFEPDDTESAVLYFQLLKDMRNAGHRIDTRLYIILLRRLSEVAKHLRKSDEEGRAQVVANVRRTHELISLDGSLVPDVPLWNNLMETYRQVDCFSDALELWNTLFLMGDYDSSTVDIILEACSVYGANEAAVDIYMKLHDRGYHFDSQSWNEWLEYLCRLGRLDDAIKLLCLEMPKLKAARPEASTIQMVLNFASQENREEEVRSRIKRYLPDLWHKLPTGIRRESL